MVEYSPKEIVNEPAPESLELIAQVTSKGSHEPVHLQSKQTTIT